MWHSPTKLSGEREQTVIPKTGKPSPEPEAPHSRTHMVFQVASPKWSSNLNFRGKSRGKVGQVLA